MPDRYQTLFGTSVQPPAGGVNEAAFRRWYETWAKKLGLDPNPDDPRHRYDYRAAFKAGAGPDPITGHWPSQFKTDDHPNRFVGIIDTKTGKPRQIPGAEPGLGRAPIPDTSLAAIAKEAVGLGATTAVSTNVGLARLPSQAIRITKDLTEKVGESIDPHAKAKKTERADAYLKLFGGPRGEATARSLEFSHNRFDPLKSTADLAGKWEQAARERLAEASQDLPTPLAVAVHQGATMAGMLADPTLGAGAGKAPRALSEAAQEAAVTAGRRPGLGARAEAALQKGYGKLVDAAEAEAAVRDRLNRIPGFREAYYGDRLDEVELGLQRLREAEDAQPIPPYLRPADRAPQAPPAVNRGLRLRSVGNLDPDQALHRLATEVPVGPIAASDLPFELRDLPLTRWHLPQQHSEAIPGVEFFTVGDNTHYTRSPSAGGNNLKLETFTPENPLVVNGGASAAAKSMGLAPMEANFDVAERGLVKYARGKGHDSIVTLHPGDNDLQVIKLPGARPGASRTSPYLEAYRDAIQGEGWREFTTSEEAVKIRQIGKSYFGGEQSAGAYHFQQTGHARLLEEYGITPPAKFSSYGERNAFWRDALTKIPDDGSRRSILARGYIRERMGLEGMAAPPNPEAQGGIVTSDVSDRSLSPSAGASPPLGPRPGSGEAGFIKLLPDPLSPADAAARGAGWQMRKDFAATNRLGRYRAGAQAEELQRLIPKETDEALTWMFHGLGDPRNYANRPPRVQARIARKTAAQRRVIDQVLADPNAESALQEVAAWRERSQQMWDELSEMWDLGFVKNYLHMTYEAPAGIKPSDAFRRASATPGMARQRTFMNPAEATAAGYTPRTLRFSQLRAETEKVFSHAQAVRNLVDDLGTMPRLQDGRAPLTYATAGKQPAGYVHVPEWARPVFDAAARRSTTSGRALPGAVKHAEALQAESRRAAETAGGFFRYTDEGKAVPSVLEQPMIPHTEAGRFRYGATDRGTMIPSHKEWEGLGPRTFRPPRTPTTPEDLWVHPEIWKELKPVLDTAEPIALDRFLGTVKRVKFLGSIFHPFELGLAAMQSMGPVKGAKAWASRGGGLPGLAQLAERRGWATPFTREVTEKWVRRGLGVEAPSADMMTDSFQRAMVGFEDAMQRAALGGPAGRLAQGAGAAGRGLRRVAGYYDEAIWGVLHSRIKIAAAEQWEAQIRAALSGDRKAMGITNRFLTGSTRGKLAAMTEEEIGEAVASAINNHFGGQVWELSRNTLFSDPRALKWMRRIFLSPDWNVSAISSGLAPLSRDPVHRIIGRTYWTNITALAAGFSVLNYLLTIGSEQGAHFPWENEEGHKMDLETPFRTDKGRKIFYRVGKHAQELPHFAWGVPGVQQLKFILGKTSPVVHALAGLAGESVTEYPSPYEELVRERERTGETPGPIENLWSRLQPSVEMMLPFSIQDAEDPGDVARKLLISIPESKGMSTYKAENLFADALVEQAKAEEAGDAEGAAEARARQEQIITWLRQNGYGDDAIDLMINGAIRSGGAMGKAKRRLRAGR